MLTGQIPILNEFKQHVVATLWLIYAKTGWRCDIEKCCAQREDLALQYQQEMLEDPRINDCEVQ